MKDGAMICCNDVTLYKNLFEMIAEKGNWLMPNAAMMLFLSAVFWALMEACCGVWKFVSCLNGLVCVISCTAGVCCC